MSQHRFARRWLVCLAAAWLLYIPCAAQAADAVSPPPLDAAERAAAARMAGDVTIYRDAWGTPHIHGKTDAHVAFGFAYSQGEDYFWQVEDSYILSLGRYSEVYGRMGLNSDLLNKAFDVVAQSQETYRKLDPKLKEYCAAFAMGLNYYLATHPETKPRLITHFEPWHPLAFGRHILLELCFRYTRLSHNYLPRTTDLLWTAAGSNGWAIAPERTKSGHAMLFVNPHLPNFGFSQMYEAHLKSDEGWSFMGGTMFGSCVPTMGHNDMLGWTFTTNEPDIADVWRLTFDDPEHPLRYRHGEGYREATETPTTIKVKLGANVVDQVVRLRKTHLGPVVVCEDDQHYLAARIAGMDGGQMLGQQLSLVKARDLEQFKDGLAMQQFPIMNVIYADRAGNIFYLYNGLVPRRDPQFNWSQPVDGADPRTEWHGLHAVSELPQLLNPADGFVQNCNSSPFTTCANGNLDPAKYPSYMVEDAKDDKRRAKMSRELLSKMKGITFEDLQVSAFDTSVYWALHELPKYRERFEELKSREPKLAARVEPYLKHLLEWDGHISAESTAATLCEAWYEELYSTEYPAETLLPKYIEKPDLEFEALASAAEKLQMRHRDWKVPWGTLFRLQRQPNMVDFRNLPFDDKLPSAPCLAAPGPMGIVFTQYYSPSVRFLSFISLNKRYGLVGTSYMAVYEFGEKIRGASALNFGGSGDPKSPHFFDQAQLLADRKLKPDLFEWEDVLAGAKLVYHPGEKPASPSAN